MSAKQGLFQAPLAVVTALLTFAAPLHDAGAQPAEAAPTTDVEADATAAAPEPEPQPAAPAASEDEVRLKNGGMYRGSLAEVIPNDHVTLMPVIGGEPKVIPWDEIAALVRNGEVEELAAEPEPPAAPAPPVADFPSARDEPSGPRLHIEVDGRGEVELHRVLLDLHGNNVSAVASERVCRAPCDQPIERTEQSEFFMVGGRVGSKRFNLDGRGSSIHATVRPGNRGLRIGGWFAATTGISSTLLGAGFLGLSTQNPDYKKPGGVMLGIGIPLLVGGIIMALRGRTKVSFGS